MLYELIAICRTGSLPQVKQIAKTAGKTVIDNGGTVRKFHYWGDMFLPRTVRRNQGTHHAGTFFAMTFACSDNAQKELRKVLKLDARMLKCNIVRLARTMGSVARVECEELTRY
jgi:small subunit ribosomal protein S6